MPNRSVILRLHRCHVLVINYNQFRTGFMIGGQWQAFMSYIAIALYNTSNKKTNEAMEI